MTTNLLSTKRVADGHEVQEPTLLALAKLAVAASSLLVGACILALIPFSAGLRWYLVDYCRGFGGDVSLGACLWPSPSPPAKARPEAAYWPSALPSGDWDSSPVNVHRPARRLARADGLVGIVRGRPSPPGQGGSRLDPGCDLESPLRPGKRPALEAI